MDRLKDDPSYARTHYAIDVLDGNTYWLDGNIKEYTGSFNTEDDIPAAARTAWRRRVAAHCRRAVKARVLRADEWHEWVTGNTEAAQARHAAALAEPSVVPMSP